MQLLAPNSSGGIRSLVCDNDGIVIAETVYRCMMCAEIFDSIDHVHTHFQLEHGEDKVGTHSQNVLKNAREIDYENDDFDLHQATSPASLLYSELFSKARGLHEWPDNEENSENLISNNAVNESLGSKSAKLSPSTSSNGATLKGGGYVTCAVCNLTKFYSHISRRYGVFSCESCAKFFYRYCQKPVQFSCPNNNNCPLNIDLPGARCKSCLLKACLNKYILDPKKHPRIFSKESLVSESHFNTQENRASMSGESSDEKSSLITNSTKSVKIKPSPTLLIDDKCLSPSDEKKPLISSTNIKKRKCEPSDDNTKLMRRGACRQCVGCLAQDCGKCLYCLDKPKFGGSDVKKQKCIRRRCLHS